MSDWHGITVTFQRAVTETDDHNNKVVTGWSTFATTAATDGVSFDPGGSSELTADGRNGVVSEPRLLRVPNSIDVQPADRVLIDGESTPFEVVAEPANYGPPWHTAWKPGQVINLRRVQG